MYFFDTCAATSDMYRFKIIGERFGNFLLSIRVAPVWKAFVACEYSTLVLSIFNSNVRPSCMHAKHSNNLQVFRLKSAYIEYNLSINQERERGSATKNYQ